MNNLTTSDLQEIHDDILNKCIELFPLDKWVHQNILGSKITIETYKSCFAKAHLNPEINYISFHPMFTTLDKERFQELIKRVLVHEFTHLIVGLKNNHNSKFIRIQSYIFDKLNIDLERASKEAEEFEGLIDYKWNVYAILSDGTEYFIGGVHRKTKRYSEYPRTERECDKIARGEHIGKKVLKYKFVANR